MAQNNSTAYRVEVNDKQVEAAIDRMRFIGANARDAMRVGINKTLPRVKTQGAKQIYDYLNLTSRDIKKRLGVVKATRQRLSGKVTAESRGRLLSRFASSKAIKTFQTTKVPQGGIKVRVLRASRARRISEAGLAAAGIKGKPFLIRLKDSNAVAIAGRRAAPGPNGGKIQVLYGYSMSQAWRFVTEDSQDAFQQIYETELLDAVRFIMQKKKPR